MPLLSTYIATNILDTALSYLAVLAVIVLVYPLLNERLLDVV